MKKIILVIAIVFSSIFITENVSALSIARAVNENGAAIRKSYSTTSTSLGTLKYNDVVPTYSTTLVKSTKGCSDGWYKIDYNGTIGYVCSSYVSTSTITARINSKDGVNTRSGPGTDNTIYKNFKNNEMITLTSTTKYKSTKGCSAGWYKLRYNTVSKYVCSTYIDNINSNSNLIITSTLGGNLKASTTTTTNYKTLKYNQALTLYDKTKYQSSNCSSGYYKVYYNNSIKYICSNAVLNSKYNVTVNNKSGLNIRKDANTSSTVIASLKYNDHATLVDSEKHKGTGCSAGYYKIKYNGYYRYICSNYTSTSSLAYTVNSSTKVNIRKGAGTNYDILTTLNNGDNLILQNTEKYTGTGCTAGWYKININTKTGYICSTYAKDEKKQETTTTNNTTATSNSITTKSINSGKYYLINKWTYRINEDYAYARSGPATSYAVKDTLFLGTELTYVSYANSWYKVKYYNGKIGYIYKDYVDKYQSVTKEDTSYCTTLKNKGFPASYCPYLTYIHSKHPKWVFTPEKTGVTFENAINGESGRNYTQNTASAYLKSTTIVEAGGWRVANTGYTAFMLDPRNYLNEKNIFAFEKLSYDKTNQTSTVVRSILDGTWLDTDTYASYFINAGSTYNISPTHLAARVKQEGGSSKTYAGVSGTVTTTWNVANNAYVCSSFGTKSSSTFKVNSGTINVRKGAGTNYSKLTYPNGNSITVNSNDSITLVSTTRYKGTGCDTGWYKVNINKSLKSIYNFYNIGAYGSNPVIRGLAAAAGYVDSLSGTPWNTREKAIKYGASFIANGYINKGQDTMYYQKFNTGPNNYYDKYTHQYMTNILAPASESLSSYRSYSNLGILDKPYVFKIPVYSSMPSQNTTHPQVK